MSQIDKLRAESMRVLAILAVISALVLGVFAIAWGQALYAGIAAAITVVPVGIALSGYSHLNARLAIGATLPLYAAIAVAVDGGGLWQMDMHMLFFAYLATLALLADWRVIIAASAVTAVHHLTLNFVAPALVFADGANFVRVMFHAGIVIMESTALIYLSLRISALFDEISAKHLEQQEQDAAAAAQEKERIERQLEIVTTFSEGLSRLSEGDFTYRVKLPASADRVSTKLAATYNASVERLSGIIEEVRASATSVNNCSSEINAAAGDLANRNEHQAANLEETAAATNNATNMVKKTAESAEKAQINMSLTNERAHMGGEVVRKAIEAMGAIESSSSEITQIIDVIDGIAFQTNLLALNAGVEAARAGEAGKGFAVVASEVRELAQRSANAARDIKELISKSTTHVGHGVSLVNETGELLEQIAQHLGAMNEEVVEIAGMASSQATDLEQVNLSIRTIDGMTQQNAAMVEETTAAARSLRGEAERLTGLVSQLRTDKDADAAIPATLAQAA